ncbi:MAG: CHAT domain-containing tetratricopeptide repeat protein [Blastocatellia bacterium]
MRNLFFLLISIMLCFVCFFGTVEAQTETELKVEILIERELKPADTHVYLVSLKGRTQFKIDVQSVGIDISIEFISPTGEILNRVNEFSSLNAVEQLVDVTENTGFHKFIIKPGGRNSIKGKYRINLLSSDIILNDEIYESYLLAQKAFVKGQTFEEMDGGSEEENLKLFNAAIEKYKHCINLYTSIGDTHRVCELNNKLGDIYANYLYKDPNAYELAISHFTTCLEKYQSIGNALGESIALNNIGYVLQLQKKYDYAFEHYRRSTIISREVLKDAYEEALTLYNIGVLVNVQGKLQEALGYYEEAIGLLEKIQVFGLSAKMCNELLRIYKQQNQKQLVLETYDRQTKLYSLANDYDSCANAFANKGEFCRQVYAKDLSIATYQQSFSLYEKINNKQGMGRILNEIGKVYDQYGETYLALDFYEKALPIAKDIKNQDLIVSILNGLGVGYSKTDRFEKAISLLFEALEIATKENFKLVTLSNIGFVYSGLTDTEKSLSFYEQALVLAKKLKDLKNESIILNNIAIEQIKLGNLTDAKNNLNLAQSKFIEIADEFGQASVLSRIGDIELKEGNVEKALDLLQKALQIRTKISDSVGQIYTRNLIGIAQNILGDKKSAIENANKGLEMSRRIFNEPAELTSIYTLAKLEISYGNLKRASDLMEESIKKIELVRSQFVSRAFQSSYFATKQKYYELYVDILMSMHKSNPTQGYDKEAFLISEKMRSRALLESLGAENIEQKINSSVEHQFLTDQLSYLATQIIKLKNDSNNNEYEIIKLGESLDKTKTKLELLKTAMSNNTRQTNHVNTILKMNEIQKLLDADTVLIQYSLGDNSSYAWLVTNKENFVFTLPSRTKIEEMAEKIYVLLTERNRDVLETLKDKKYRIRLAEDEYMTESNHLSNIIILPMQQYLVSKKRIIISPDGGLHTIPFNALPYNNSKFLIEEYEIVVVPSASTLNFIRQTKSSGIRKIIVFADPIFNNNDPRISKTRASESESLVSQTKINTKRRDIRDFNFTRLEGTRHEAESIKKFFPKRSEFFVGPDAKKEIVQSLKENGLSLHFGTHSLLFHNNPQLSCVVLSLIDELGRECPGFLTIEDILNLNFAPELVTLSSCQSAKGKEVAGEGVISLTTAFFYIGARRVVSSLWSVDDDSTAQLMSNFYKNISNGSMPSSALRQAQIEMLKIQQYKSPYYWAAFQLQGDYK